MFSYKGQAAEQIRIDRAELIKQYHAEAMDAKARAHNDELPAAERRAASIRFNSLLTQWHRQAEAYRFDYGNYPDLA